MCRTFSLEEWTQLRVKQIEAAAIFEQSVVYTSLIDFISKPFEQSFTILGAVASVLFILNNIAAYDVVSDGGKSVDGFDGSRVGRVVQLGNDIGQVVERETSVLIPLVGKIVLGGDLVWAGHNLSGL